MSQLYFTWDTRTYLSVSTWNATLQKVMMQNPQGHIIAGTNSNELTWINVGIAMTFILFDIGVSSVFRLGIGISVLISALRCMGQLALVATILHKVFETKNPWLVALICCAFCYVLIHPSVLLISCLVVVLNFLGTFETGTSARLASLT
jgi:ABC-type iron transport system FetAB permease component